MENRLAKIRSFLPQLKVDALFVSNPVNIRYLTKTVTEDAWLLVTLRNVFYITDFRYIEKSKEVYKDKGIEVVQYEQSLFETVIGLSLGDGVKALGFEENHVTFYQHSRLKSFCVNKIRLKGLSGAIEALRVVKSAEEIATIRKAVKVNLKGFEFIKSFIQPGVTERAIYYKLQDFIRKESVGFSFPPIIASGPNSAYPHAKITDRKLKDQEPLLLDFGVEIDGYKSDLTRMFFLGKMRPSFQKKLDFILSAQEQAFRKIMFGVEARVVDAAARDFLEKNGLAQFFGHSLGHGVGLDTHEMPRLSGKSAEVLLENMIVTVEPGIYFPGQYGVRQEEMVLVTKTGCEVLSGHRDHGSR